MNIPTTLLSICGVLFSSHIICFGTRIPAITRTVLSIVVWIPRISFISTSAPSSSIIALLLLASSFSIETLLFFLPLHLLLGHRHVFLTAAIL